MRYEDYLNNAEKHFVYCKETMSIMWERRFVDELCEYIKGKSQYYLGKYDTQYIIDKINTTTDTIAITKVEIDRLKIFFSDLVEKKEYDIISLNAIDYYDTLTNNRNKCETEWVKPLQKRLYEIYKVCKSFISNEEILDTISNDLHKTTNEYKRIIENKFKEQQKKLFYIFLNTFYISGYIYEGIAMFSILKLLGFKYSDLPSTLSDLGKSEYYIEQQLRQYVEDDDLQSKFGDFITTHGFKEYITIIRGNQNLNSEQQDIEFIGKDIKDNTLKELVNNWSPKVRYKQFDNNHLFCIPNTTIDIRRNDIDKLLGLSETIINNVKDRIRI